MLKKPNDRRCTRAWRRLRAGVLKRDNYLCIPCQKAGRLSPAEEVDHIVEIWQGGSDDWANLQSICIPCHKAKTHSKDRDAPIKPRELPRLTLLKPRLTK